MNSDDSLEEFEIKSDEDETKFIKCCSYKLENNIYCVKTRGHSTCILCIEQQNVWNAT